MLGFAPQSRLWHIPLQSVRVILAHTCLILDCETYFDNVIFAQPCLDCRTLCDWGLSAFRDGLSRYESRKMTSLELEGEEYENRCPLD